MSSMIGIVFFFLMRCLYSIFKNVSACVCVHIQDSKVKDDALING
jgi:hypothetical protein